MTTERPAPQPGDGGFADVSGMEDVKRAIHRTILLPLQRPELARRYNRRAGGAVLLYGPPGCGKTMLARAISSELGLPLVNVRLENVLSPYFGASEGLLHDAFSAARELSPAVLFVDELDALGFARHRTDASSRRLVDVLLQELDAVGADNDGVLSLAATNAPWDLDDALLRPGRFDRVMFVPPPDEPARAALIRLLVRDVHAADVDAEHLARITPLFSGADLRGLVDQAVELVIDEVLEWGDELPLRTQHLVAALRGIRPTTLDWLRRARTYVEFSDSHRYDDIAGYLRSKVHRIEAARYS